MLLKTVVSYGCFYAKQQDVFIQLTNACGIMWLCIVITPCQYLHIVDLWRWREGERESRFVGLYLNGFTPFEPISFMIVSNIDILTCCLQHTGPRKLGTLLILMCDDLGRPLALLEMIHGIFGALLKSRLPLGFGVWKFGELFIGVSWGCFIIKVWATSQQV